MIPKSALYRLAAALEGVAIVGVLPGSPSARAGMRYGDVLLEVNGRRVKTFDDYIAARGQRTDGMDVVFFRSGTARVEALVYDETTSPPDLRGLVRQLAEGRLGVAPEERPADPDEPPS
jgi:S1-C subfamily serine protease